MLDQDISNLAQRAFNTAREVDFNSMMTKVREIQTVMAFRGISGGPSNAQICNLACEHTINQCSIARAELIRSCLSYDVQYSEILLQDLNDAFSKMVSETPTLMVSRLKDQVIVHANPQAGVNDLKNYSFQGLATGSAAALTEFEHYTAQLKSQHKKQEASNEMTLQEDLRLRVLLYLVDHFNNSTRFIETLDIANELGSNQDKAVFQKQVGNALQYLRTAEAIDATRENHYHDADYPCFVVSGVTARGTDMAAGKLPVSNSLISYNTNTWNIAAQNVANAGIVTGDVTQNVGASFGDLAKALDALRAELQDSDDVNAIALNAVAEKAAALARVAQPDRNGLQKLLSAAGQIVQTLGEAPQAWAFIAVEMTKLGLNIPGPPLLPPH